MRLGRKRVSQHYLWLVVHGCVLLLSIIHDGTTGVSGVAGNSSYTIAEETTVVPAQAAPLTNA